MIRPALLALGVLAVAGLPALAMDFDETAKGQVEFVMPSGNIGCIYTPQGGTDICEPMGGGPELSCDRVFPLRVIRSRAHVQAWWLWLQPQPQVSQGLVKAQCLTRFQLAEHDNPIWNSRSM